MIVYSRLCTQPLASLLKHSLILFATMPMMKAARKKKGAPIKRPACAGARGTTRSLADSWHKPAGGAAEPDWAGHLVDILEAPLLGLKRKLGASSEMVLWSDCVGKCTEKFAMHKLADALMEKIGMDIKFNLYAAGDADRKCKDFVKANFEPLHFADDIHDRDFKADTFGCRLCADARGVLRCAMPRTGVDIYWCCFPCRD